MAELKNVVSGKNPATDQDSFNNYLNSYLQYIDTLDELKTSSGGNPYDVGGFGSDRRTQLSQAFMQNGLNYVLANLENDWNVAQWKRQVEWDSPANQVERFKEAGLSSAAAAQAAQGFASPNLESANLANQEAGFTYSNKMQDVLGALGSFAQYARQLVDIRKETAESELLESQAGVADEMLFTRLDVDRWVLKNIMQDYHHKEQMFPSQKETAEHNAEASGIDVNARRQALINQKQTYDLMKQKFDFLEKMNEKQLVAMDKDLQKIDQDMQKTRKEIQEIESRIALNNKLGKVAENEALLKEKQAKGETLKNLQQVYQNTLTKFGSPEDIAGRSAALAADGQVTHDEQMQYFRGTREYLIDGWKEYKDYPAVQEYYHYYINEGDKQMLNSGLHTIGGYYGLPRLFGIQ